MTKYQHMQSRARAELDAAIGTGILPTLADQYSLPYLAAIVKECLRWGLLAPFAVPHMLTKDDEYEGMFLPGGSLILPNSWCVSSFALLQYG